jgi:hypothetical protein
MNEEYREQVRINAAQLQLQFKIGNQLKAQVSAAQFCNSFNYKSFFAKIVSSKGSKN